MKRNKAFTLVELIGVITIIGIISLITVPTINNAINHSKEKTYQKNIDTIISSAKLWNVDNMEVNTSMSSYDVFIILDDSNSMINSNRMEYSVTAINSIMKSILSENINNRIGIIRFSGTVSELLPINHYYSTNANGDFMEMVSTGETYHTYKVSNGVIDSNGTSYEKTINTTDNTASQLAIKTGLEAVYNSRNSSNNLPIVFFVTDGEPYGVGVYSDYINCTGSSQKTSSENLMYHTILTANYWENKIYQDYGIRLKFYTLGLGITAKNTIAFLNPTPENLAHHLALKALLDADTNPYKDHYQYVEASYTGENLTDIDISGIISSAISNALFLKDVTVEQLVEANLLDESVLIDPRDNSKQLDGYVHIKYVDKNDNTILCTKDSNVDDCIYTYEYIENVYVE